VQKVVVEIEKEDSLIIVSKYWMKWRNMKSLPTYMHLIWFYKHVRMHETVKMQRKLFIVRHSKEQTKRYKIYWILLWFVVVVVVVVVVRCSLFVVRCSLLLLFVIRVKRLHNKEKKRKNEMNKTNEIWLIDWFVIDFVLE
jgi:hypothetical protein